MELVDIGIAVSLLLALLVALWVSIGGFSKYGQYCRRVEPEDEEPT